jgi:penicillin-binding protein 1A
MADPEGRSDGEPLSIRREWRRRRSLLRRRRRRRLRMLAASAFLLLGLAIGSGAGALALLASSPGAIMGCHLATARPHLFGRDSFVYAGDGSGLGAVPTSRNREPVRLTEMSRWLPEATVAIEDRRFWRHGGVDYQAILRAAIADLEAGRTVQGGSTLAQQLVRDRYLPRARMTLSRKVKEACLAIELARAWPRQRILEAYLNLVFYGRHAYGVEAAAHTFFARHARDLTLAQAALLAGLPQAPTTYDPLRHPSAALRRRNEVLAAMLRARVITAGRYRRAVAAPLGLRPGSRYARVRGDMFFGYVLRQLAVRFGSGRARHGGLEVQTTLDPRLQRLAQRAIRGWLRQPTDPAAALVAIDPRDGAIRAMAGEVPGRQRLRFNLATQAHRQAGSAFKVFTLVTALEQGIPLSSVWHGPSSLTIPARQCPNGTDGWPVHNFADEAHGTMTLRSAIAHSVNTIFAQVIAKVRPWRVVAVAQRMGITTPLTPVCAITLGAEGVSPLEMTTAFATLATGGVRHDPQAIEQVRTAGGAVLAGPATAGRRVLSADVAGKATSALTGVIRSGTGVAANPGRPAAGKTGTAQSYKDAWFCGYVPQLAACVWLGFPQAEIPMANVEGFAQVVGGSVPARIWHDFMVPALRGVPVQPLR